MRRICRRMGTLLCLLAGLVLAGALLQPLPAQAQQGGRCFAETGYCIGGAFLEYWEQNGGLAVFGYPISDVRTETIEGSWTGSVQWFERDRLEDHGIDGILAGRLGAYLLEQQGYNWWDAAEQPDEDKAGCRSMEATQHYLCEPFLSYWQANDGLSRFGYPITGAYVEQIGDWEGLVQYFERRRMEYHTESGQPAVLLGHLGQEVLREYGSRSLCSNEVAAELRDSFQRVPFHSRLGCPQEVAHDAAAAVQPFERGHMLHVRLNESERTIFALSTMPALFQRSYPTAWDADGADLPAPAAISEPPAGLSRPESRFAEVWQQDADLPARLGWATAPAYQERTTVQRFDNGWLALVHGSNRFYAFGPHSVSLVSFVQPQLTAGEPRLLAGVPAPQLGGELVARTQSVDFYRSPGGLTASEIRALSSAVEESIASGSTMLGSNLAGRVSLRFEPAQRGVCAIRGLTLSNQRTIRMFYDPGSNLRRIESILAHEFVHQLQHDLYGARDHLRSDVILLEGMAMWGSSPYTLDSSGQPYYHAEVQQALEAGTLLPLTTSLEADCRTTTRNTIYEQWASFTEYLLITYGREKLDAVYTQSAGRPAGSANYQAVYGKSLAQLEAEWVAWLQRGRR